MAELMYKIANEEAPDIRVIRPGIPQRLANIAALSLTKRPESRYQDGARFAAGLPAGAAPPGYDATHALPAGEPAAFEQTNVIRRPGTPVPPAAGDGDTDLEQ